MKFEAKNIAPDSLEISGFADGVVCVLNKLSVKAERVNETLSKYEGNDPISEILSLNNEEVLAKEASSKKRKDEIDAIVKSWETEAPKFGGGEMVSWLENGHQEMYGIVEDVRRRKSVGDYKGSLYMDSPFEYYVDGSWKFEAELRDCDE